MDITRRDFLKTGAASAAGLAFTASGLDAVFPEPAGAAEGTGGAAGAGAPISLPKGGGAIRGIGETFQPNLFTGTGNFSIPIFTSPGRSGFGPQLSLQYSTGSGNGPFGLGWQLSIPRITRKTAKGLPTYTNEDVFIMSGAEDLVPRLKRDGTGIDTFSHNGYTITRYRPRTEGLFAKIEKWVKNGKSVHWRATTRENVTSIYGRTAAARIAHPDDAGKIYEWLLEKTFDASGNHILYEYVQEKPDQKIRGIFEKNRRYTQAYIRRILYGNTPKNFKAERKAGPSKKGLKHGSNLATDQATRHYVFEVLFDYFDLPEKPPIPFKADKFPEGNMADPADWPETTIREDPFSTFRAGFEIRTLRRCRRVLMLHHFKEGELDGAPLVKSTEFGYRTNPDTLMSFLDSVKVTGYRKDPQQSDRYLSREMPPVTFKYSEFKPHQQRYQPVTAQAGDFQPRSLADPDFNLVDLYGDGLPDILNTTDTGFYYWRNIGGGKIKHRNLQQEMPAGVTLSNPVVAFGDMGGDGLADLLIEDTRMAGFFEATPDGKWKQFKRFKTMPSFRLSNPDTRLVDLTGDGLSDVLMPWDHHFLWFRCKGEDGYDKPRSEKRVNDLDKFPNVSFSDSSGRVRLADMSGDGMTDIVMVHSGRIDYWPNLGYNKWGSRISMAESPRFGYGFDPKRLFFVDLDGSGCADLVYVESGKVRFWFNRSGNGWSKEQIIPGTPPVTDVTAVQFADFFGSGTACLVWSYDFNFQTGGNYRVLDFCGGAKPHLLIEMDNNMGTTTRARYAPSTRFYLEDREKGKPWGTALPFPVQVLEKTEVIDHIGRTKLVTTYKYHHGYYDGREREFRGFGRVDRFDSEEFKLFSRTGLHDDNAKFENNNQAFHVPTVMTRTWFHTGVYFDRDRLADHKDLIRTYREKEYYTGDSQAFEMEGNRFQWPNGSITSGADSHEAYRALRGAILRSEVYALDGDRTEDVPGDPYAVTESQYLVRQLQTKTRASTSGDRDHPGVYLTIPEEILSYHYERDPADPRIGHRMTLEVDRFGNVLKSVAIGYGRRTPNKGLSAGDQAKQAQTLVTYAENKYTNAVAGNTAYRTPMLCESRSFELTGYTPVAGKRLFRPTDFVRQAPKGFAHIFDTELGYEEKPKTGKQRRCVDHSRIYFRPDDLGRYRNDPLTLLPLGTLESLALPGESYNLAFTSELAKQIYVDSGELAMSDLNRILAAEGKYAHTEGDANWWIPSGRVFLSPSGKALPAQELAHARDNFFLPHRFRDPFHTDSAGTETEVVYDAYGLLTFETRDPLGNRVTAGERLPNGALDPDKPGNDYRVLQPRLLMDPNRNRTEVVFDTLGLVTGTAVMGKPEDNPRQGDTIDASFKADLSDADIDAFYVADDPVALAHGHLKRASMRVIYDMDRFYRTRRASPQNPEKWEPVFAATLVRDTHDSDLNAGDKSRLQINFSYSDGFTREIQKKIQAEDGPLVDGGPDVSLRWVGSGWTVLNNKGKSVRQYEPFFSRLKAKRHRFEFGVRFGVSPILFYDPLDRVVASLHPNKTWEKVVFSPWRQESWDVNDTVTQSPAGSDDLKSFFKRPDGTDRIPDSEYLPTWHGLRTDPNHAGDADRKWPDTRQKAAEDRAAQKAKVHAGTPAVTHLDALGRPFLTVADNGKNQSGVSVRFSTLVDLDIEGNDIKINDPRGVEAFENRFDIAGRKVRIDSVDAGLQLTLPDALSNLIYFWDSNGHRIHNLYDRLRRRTEVRVEKDNKEWLAEKTVYGKAINPASDNKNHRGRVWNIYDGAGLSTTDAYDFKGNVRKQSRRLLKKGDAKVRWPLANGSFDAGQAENLLEPGNRAHSFESVFDALNRLIRLKMPDGTVQEPGYNLANLLESVTVARSGKSDVLVTNIDYNEKGQRTLIEYQNGVSTEYTYDLETYRLIRMLTKRGGSKTPKILQEIHYTYDPVGNITEIRDDAHPRLYNRNTEIKPESQYTYDAVYRLIEATGREHESMSECHHRESAKKHTEFIQLTDQPASNGRALVNYTEKYEYDESGNITLIHHRNSIAGSTPRQRVQTYQPGSNRLATSDAGCANESTFEYHKHTDGNGNIEKMPHLPAMEWDFRNQLIKVQLNVGSPPNKAYYQYDAAGQRVRKTVVKNGTTEERLYLGGYEIYIEKGSSGPKLRRDTIHVMDDKNRIALIEIKKNPTNGQDIPNTRRDRFQYSNHLGSATLELDNSVNATIISYEEYHPYGGTAYLAGEKETEAKKKRYRYSGKERDDETGLHYYGARYYACWIGRWINTDPIALRGGLNLYAFVSNNPINKKDLIGLSDTATIEVNKSAGRSAHDNMDAVLTSKGERGPQIKGREVTYQKHKGGSRGDTVISTRSMESKSIDLSKYFDEEGNIIEGKLKTRLKRDYKQIVKHMKALKDNAGELSEKLGGEVPTKESAFYTVKGTPEQKKQFRNFARKYAREIAKDIGGHVKIGVFRKGLGVLGIIGITLTAASASAAIDQTASNVTDKSMLSMREKLQTQVQISSEVGSIADTAPGGTLAAAVATVFAWDATSKMIAIQKAKNKAVDRIISGDQSSWTFIENEPYAYNISEHNLYRISEQGELIPWESLFSDGGGVYFSDDYKYILNNDGGHWLIHIRK